MPDWAGDLELAGLTSGGCARVSLGGQHAWSLPAHVWSLNMEAARRITAGHFRGRMRVKKHCVSGVYVWLAGWRCPKHDVAHVCLQFRLAASLHLRCISCDCRAVRLKSLQMASAWRQSVLTARVAIAPQLILPHKLGWSPVWILKITAVMPGLLPVCDRAHNGKDAGGCSMGDAACPGTEPLQVATHCQPAHSSPHRPTGESWSLSCRFKVQLACMAELARQSRSSGTVRATAQT